MRSLEVFADIACPFAHAGLARFCAARAEAGLREPVLVVRAWPLELINEQPHDGHALAPKVRALRADVAPDRFGGFDASRFPTTSIPALEAEAAARSRGLELGELFSLAVRDALFDQGLDISSPDVLDQLRREFDLPGAGSMELGMVERDLEEGRQRGVLGSPYFFTRGGGFFCPSLDIQHEGAEYEVQFDPQGFERFLRSALGGRYAQG